MRTEIFQARGGEPGHDLDDWLQAELRAAAGERRAPPGSQQLISFKKQPNSAAARRNEGRTVWKVGQFRVRLPRWVGRQTAGIFSWFCWAARPPSRSASAKHGCSRDLAYSVNPVRLPLPRLRQRLSATT